MGWSEAACRKCTLRMSVGGVTRYVSGRFFSWVQNRLAIDCPTCHGLIPAFATTCQCGAKLTLGLVWEETLGRHGERLRRMTTRTPANMRRFQWGYLAISAAALWITLGVLEKHFEENWGWHALLSVLYLGVIILLIYWLVPRDTLFTIGGRTSRLVKFGMVFNYLTALGLMQMFFGTWWTRSLMLAGFFSMSWFGAWLFWSYLWPGSMYLAWIFTSSPTGFEPRDSQGRKVEVD